MSTIVNLQKSTMPADSLVRHDQQTPIFSECDIEVLLNDLLYQEEPAKNGEKEYELQDAVLDFILSKHSQNCMPSTIKFYTYYLGRIEAYLLENGITKTNQITKQHFNCFVADIRAHGLADGYLHQYARVFKTFTKFLLREGYIASEILVTMPIIRPKRQLVYSIDQVRQILSACKDERDRAFILFMVDSGLRLSEARALKWLDINFKNGLVRVENGKGGKFRSAVISPETRRALIKYKSTQSSLPADPVFQTKYGTRLTESGLRSWITRLGDRADIHITLHALRRTFATLSVKAGSNLFELQALLGHSTLDMTRQYVTLLDEDLIEGHANHSPVKMILGR